MKKTLVFIFTVLILVIIFYFITFLESLKTPSVATDAQKPESSYSSYDKSSTEKLLLTVTTRPTLVPKDLIAKEKLIDSLKNKGGVIFKTENYILEYVKSADSFMAELKNTNVDSTKKEVVDYFRSKGISDMGICSLPLVFYLNSETSKSYSLSSQKFRPLPDFCN